MCQDFLLFLRLDNTLLYVHTEYYLSSHLLMSIQVAFHLLAVVNNAPVTMGLRSLLLSLWVINTEVELPDQMVILFLRFEEPPYHFPQWLCHCIFTPAMHRGFQFFYTLANIRYILVLVIATLMSIEICLFNFSFFKLTNLIFRVLLGSQQN